MPFLRFSRDKRGYEHFYLVQPVSGRRGKTRQHILYWFRTPPNVKVGREAFDEQVRRALEAQNPDVEFDWAKLLDTPIPPPAPDVERWRERRRAARRQPPSDTDDDDATADIEEALAVAPEAVGGSPIETVPLADATPGTLRRGGSAARAPATPASSWRSPQSPGRSQNGGPGAGRTRGGCV